MRRLVLVCTSRLLASCVATPLDEGAPDAGSSTAPTCQGDGTFLAAVEFVAGASPRSVAVGDFNGDGRLDLVLGNSVPGTGLISVLLGQGEGQFAAPVEYGASGASESVAVGDFNGDGKLDAVATNGGGISLFLGVGDGTFAAQDDYTTGTQPVALAAGDLNGDGLPDLAIVDEAGDQLTVLTSNSDGSLGLDANLPTGSGPIAVAMGDLDGDGTADLVVANGSGSVGVFLGLGAGAFAPQVTYPLSLAPTSVAIGDFNGDGALDLAVATLPEAAAQGLGSVSVLLGAGHGTLGAATSFPTGRAPSSVGLGDLNGDGALDLAVANSADGTVSILLGRGEGTFAAQSVDAAGQAPSAIAVGDFNGDGWPDLALANATSPGGASILLNSSCPQPSTDSGR